MSGYSVGQKLWYVPARTRSEPSWVTVEKVGRKWLSVGRHLRLDVETLRADGGGYSSPGRAYLSEEAHTAEVDLHVAWRSFREAVGRVWNPPAHLSVADIDNLYNVVFPSPPATEVSE